MKQKFWDAYQIIMALTVAACIVLIISVVAFACILHEFSAMLIIGMPAIFAVILCLIWIVGEILLTPFEEF